MPARRGDIKLAGLSAALVVAVLWMPDQAHPDDSRTRLPSFGDLQAAGAIVGEVSVVTDDVFNEDDPKENNALFRGANALHIRTRPALIRRTLLFKTGDPLSVRLIEESERLLRDNRYLYDVSIRPVAWRDGIVDIEVRTRDTWSLAPGISFGRAGGANSGGLQLHEYNFLGTGTALGLSRRSNVDRSGTVFEISHDHLIDGWTAIEYTHSNLDDGGGQTFSLGRPFYALDTRWAAGMSMSEGDQVDPVYNAGEVLYQYRHRHKKAEVFGGLSRGLVAGWTQRYSVGLGYRDDAYQREPGLAPPPELPADDTLTGPFVRYEILEDGYERFKNRNQIERPEYFQTGLVGSLQVGRALQALGSTRDAWLYSAKIGNGFEAFGSHTLIASASLSGQYGDGRSQHVATGGMAQYYVPQGSHALFFASASANRVFDPDVSELLLLGGDNGLRGYPLRYQSGDKRVLLTIEERAYTDWFPFRLFRVGGAVFFDVGRAWGGEIENAANPGWLKDAGFGLRLLSARSAFGNILHADVAFPLDREPDIRSVQFLLKTKASF